MLKFQPGLGFSISKLVHRILLRMSSMVLAAAAAANSLQSCPTLCRVRLCVTLKTAAPQLPHPWDSPGRTLEWVAVSFSTMALEEGLKTLEFD